MQGRATVEGLVVPQIENLWSIEALRSLLARAERAAVSSACLLPARLSVRHGAHPGVWVRA